MDKTDEERRVKHAAYMREWNREHPGYRIQHPEWQRTWRARNPEKQREYQEKYRERNRAAYHSDPGKHKARVAEWRAKHAGFVKAYQREWHLLDMGRKFGLTQEQFEELRPRMDGPCEICGVMKRLVMDHDHETLKFRGLLCKSCNTGIGLLGDTGEHVRKAIAYLERSLN